MRKGHRRGARVRECDDADTRSFLQKVTCTNYSLLAHFGLHTPLFLISLDSPHSALLCQGGFWTVLPTAFGRKNRSKKFENPQFFSSDVVKFLFLFSWSDEHMPSFPAHTQISTNKHPVFDNSSRNECLDQGKQAHFRTRCARSRTLQKEGDTLEGTNRPRLSPPEPNTCCSRCIRDG